jgi:hypothetical protein
MVCVVVGGREEVDQREGREREGERESRED